MKQKELYKVRNISDIKDLINQSEELFGDRNAFMVRDSKGNYKGITYSAFKRDVDALGTALLSLGLKDEFIAVIGENRYEWCTSYLAVVNGVGTVVPLDKELPASEIKNLLTRCNASAVIYSGKFEGTMRDMSSELENIKFFINMDSSADDQGFLSYSGLVEKGQELLEKGDRTYIDVEIDNNEMKILLFTSGTTDLAKGVMLCHRNICSVITSVCSTVKITCDDSSLSILPLHHTYECTLGFMAVIYSGGCIAFNEGLKHIAKNLKEFKPTLLISVPLIVENMYKKIWDHARKQKGGEAKLKAALFISNLLHKGFGIDIRRKLFKQVHENIGGRVRVIICGAAAIDPEVSKGFGRMGLKVLQGYGLTECAPLVTGNRDSIYRDSSAGLPIPGVEVKIDNPNEIGVGEIIVKGPNVMLGYFKNEEATKKVLKNGWFHTGDLGKFGKKGFLYITGRCKNVIVTKNGKNIYPEEVEAYLNKSPYVQESLVWGKLDKKSGETQIIAQVFPDFEAIKEKFKKINISAEEITKVINEVIKSVNKEMPLYKRIRDFTIRESEFVKTTTRKIKRYMEIMEYSSSNESST